MDIFFCDECGTRVSDLDLRGGKGMRQRNDTICTGCVEQGHAASWLSRTGQAANGHGRAKANGAVAVVAEVPPDIISLARDRASTLPDDPFAGEIVDTPVEEPVALPRQAPPMPAHETDAIPVRPPPPPPSDGFSAAAGGFDALAGAKLKPEDSDDDLADRAESDADDDDPATTPPSAVGPAPATPFDAADKDAVADDNPGKAVTAEVSAQAEKPEKPEKPAKSASGRMPSASGRQASQKRGSTTTSKRASSKTTRRASNPMQSKKVLLFSLLSCAVMMVIFFTVVLPAVTTKHAKTSVSEMDEPLNRLQNRIDEAKRACGTAQQADDMAPITHAYEAVQAMRAAFNDFQLMANKQGWSEDNYSQQLRLMGYYEVQSMFMEVQHRRGIIEQRQQ